MSSAHKKSDTNSTVSISQTNTTRDEEDVAHILANVADYVRRPSPPHTSPEQQQRQSALTWPCPQISSNLVRSSPLNNNEQISTNSSRFVIFSFNRKIILSCNERNSRFKLH